MLRQLMERQEDVKERLTEIRSDLSSVGGLQTLSEGYDEDIITAVVVNRIEMRSNGVPASEEIHDTDLIWAVEFLDHLDTQGFVVRRK